MFFLCLHYTFEVGLGGGVGWANNVLALAYLLEFLYNFQLRQDIT